MAFEALDEWAWPKEWSDAMDHFRKMTNLADQAYISGEFHIAKTYARELRNLSEVMKDLCAKKMIDSKSSSK